MEAASAPSKARTADLLAGGAAIVAALVAFLYRALLLNQGGPPPDTPLLAPFLMSYILAMAILLAVSLVVPLGVKPVLRIAPATGLAVLGWLAAFSIGVAIMIAAVAAIASVVLTVQARPVRPSVASAVVGSVIAIIVLVAGLQVSWSYIACPTRGSSGGQAGLLGSSYECQDGHLTRR